MSHFAVLVITSEEPTDELLTKTLQPWHEYECTGIDDQYVIDVDVTDEVKSEYAAATVRRWVDKDGVQHDPYDDQFWREPTPAEIEKHSPLLGSGFVGGISFQSRDWGDGKGYRPKVHLSVDEAGMTEIEIKEPRDINVWAEEYGGWKSRSDGTFYRHTNPNAKWDWWQIGGRYSNKLASEGEFGDIAQRSAIDFAAMKHMQEDRRRNWINEIMIETQFVDYAQLAEVLAFDRQMHVKWLELPEPRPRGNEFNDWAETQDARLGALLRKLSNSRSAVWERPDLVDGQTVEQWIAAAPALTCWAVVKDGQWTEKGEMGWWGMSTDKMTEAEWKAQVSKLIEELPGDLWVSVVDCHI